MMDELRAELEARLSATMAILHELDADSLRSPEMLRAWTDANTAVGRAMDVLGYPRAR